MDDIAENFFVSRSKAFWPASVVTTTTLLCAFALAASPAAHREMMPYHGTVVRQVAGCEVDGPCSVEVNTREAGIIDFVWNQGEVLPDTACVISAAVMAAASTLKPGDHVEIWLPKGQRVLCGAETQVKAWQP